MEHEHVRQIQISEGSERQAGKSGLDVVAIKGHFEHTAIWKEGMLGTKKQLTQEREKVI